MPALYILVLDQKRCRTCKPCTFDPGGPGGQKLESTQEVHYLPRRSSLRPSIIEYLRKARTAEL